MPRHYPDWLQAYVDFASISEAPRFMHFWSGVSAVAGALQRKVWFNMGHFTWYPNFFIILVAPPGIVAKSTTSGIAMRLLKQVPSVTFGPNITTWQSLVSHFVDSREVFEVNGVYHEMCSLQLEASELGNLLDPRDKDMIDLFVNLWDCNPGAFSKSTLKDGVQAIVNPCVNKIACTTPQWIAENFSDYMIGGGYTSRVVFVYAEEKFKFLAYPFLEMGDDFNKQEREEKLVADLLQINTLRGEFKLSKEALAWGIAWYNHHWKNKPIGLDTARFGGYISRKQSHIHKLAMVLSAASSDTMIIEEDHIKLANLMVSDLEKDMCKVFSKIGTSQVSGHVDRLLEFIKDRKEVLYTEVYQFVHSQFPSARDFEDVIAGCIKSGKLSLKSGEKGPVLKYEKG